MNNDTPSSSRFSDHSQFDIAPSSFLRHSDNLQFDHELQEILRHGGLLSDLFSTLDVGFGANVVESASTGAADIVEAAAFGLAGDLETAWSATVALNVVGVIATIVVESDETIAWYALGVGPSGIAVAVAASRNVLGQCVVVGTTL